MRRSLFAVVVLLSALLPFGTARSVFADTPTPTPTPMTACGYGVGWTQIWAEANRSFPTYSYFWSDANMTTISVGQSIDRIEICTFNHTTDRIAMTLDDLTGNGDYFVSYGQPGYPQKAWHEFTSLTYLAQVRIRTGTDGPISYGDTSIWVHVPVPPTATATTTPTPTPMGAASCGAITDILPTSLGSDGHWSLNGIATMNFPPVAPAGYGSSDDPGFGVLNIDYILVCSPLPSGARYQLGVSFGSGIPTVTDLYSTDYPRVLLSAVAPGQANTIYVWAAGDTSAPEISAPVYIWQHQVVATPTPTATSVPGGSFCVTNTTTTTSLRVTMTATFSGVYPSAISYSVQAGYTAGMTLDQLDATGVSLAGSSLGSASGSLNPLSATRYLQFSSVTAGFSVRTCFVWPDVPTPTITPTIPLGSGGFCYINQSVIVSNQSIVSVTVPTLFSGDRPVSVRYAFVSGYAAGFTLDQVDLAGAVLNGVGLASGFGTAAIGVQTAQLKFYHASLASFSVQTCFSFPLTPTPTRTPTGTATATGTSTPTGTATATGTSTSTVLPTYTPLPDCLSVPPPLLCVVIWNQETQIAIQTAQVGTVTPTFDSSVTVTAFALTQTVYATMTPIATFTFATALSVEQSDRLPWAAAHALGTSVSLIGDELSSVSDASALTDPVQSGGASGSWGCTAPSVSSSSPWWPTTASGDLDTGYCLFLEWTRPFRVMLLSVERLLLYIAFGLWGLRSLRALSGTDAAGLM